MVTGSETCKGAPFVTLLVLSLNGGQGTAHGTAEGHEEYFRIVHTRGGVM